MKAFIPHITIVQEPVPGRFHTPLSPLASLLYSDRMTAGARRVTFFVEPGVGINAAMRAVAAANQRDSEDDRDG